MTLGGRSYLGNLERYGDAPALLSEHGNLTYAELAVAADALAKSWGSGRHLVLIACTSSIDTVVAQVAVLRNGHAAILVPAASDELIERLTGLYHPDVVMSAGQTLLRANPPPPMHADLAVLLLTSGSTGSSKLVRLSHRNLQANTESIVEYLGMTSGDRAITSLPVFYGYGLSVITTHLEVGASIVLTEYSVTDPCFWELAERYRVTSISGVPYTFELIDQGGFDQHLPTSIRYVTMSGGHSPVERVRRWMTKAKAGNFEIFSMYGSTEATSRMTYVPPAMLESAPEAIGTVMPGGEIRLEPVPEADTPGVGEIVYRGDNVMMGYAQSPADLAEGALHDELYTGDLARVGDDGLYRWMGRRSRIAKVFGLRIDLVHVEESLASRGVIAACVDAQPGIAVFAVSGEDVLDAVVDITGLPRHAISVRTIGQLPMTTVGKLDYGELRRLADEPEAPPSKKLLRRSSEKAVRDTYALVLHRPDAQATDTFASLAGDSLSYVELSIRLADLNIDTSPGWQHRSIAELAATAPARRLWTRLDSTVILRAVAIVLIVMNHSGAPRLIGGAHVLLAVAGYNFARFQLAGADRRTLWRSRWRSLAQVMVPCMLWIIAVTLLFGAYHVDSIFMLEGIQGFENTPGIRLWFLEGYFWTQVIVILALAVPLVHRFQQRSPFKTALAVLTIATLVRLAYTGIEADYEPFHHEYDLAAIAWCFAAGWAIALAPSLIARLGLTIYCTISTFGFFGDLSRELVLFTGLIVLVWIPLVPVPRRLARPIGMVASASLFIFVSHFQFAPSLIDISPWFAVAASIVFGILFERAWAFAVGRFRWRSKPPRRSIPPTANVGTPVSG